MGWYLVYLAVLFGVFCVIGAAVLPGSIRRAREADAWRCELSARHETSEVYTSPIDGSVVALSFRRSQLILVAPGDAERVYDFSRIASVQVLMNGDTLHQTNRGAQILGAAVGGALFGVVGAAVGGLSGSAKSTRRVGELGLKIVVDDQSDPIHVIRFLNARPGMSPASPPAKKAFAAVDRLHAQLTNAMRRVQQEAVPAQSPSAVGDLFKLYDMPALAPFPTRNSSVRSISSSPRIQAQPGSRSRRTQFH